MKITTNIGNSALMTQSKCWTSCFTACFKESMANYDFYLKIHEIFCSFDFSVMVTDIRTSKMLHPVQHRKPTSCVCIVSGQDVATDAPSDLDWKTKLVRNNRHHHRDAPAPPPGLVSQCSVGQWWFFAICRGRAAWRAPSAHLPLVFLYF